MLTMTRMFRSVLRTGGALVISSLVIASCVTNPANDTQSNAYFDVPTLVQQQTAWLDSVNPKVILTATIGEQTEVDTLNKDSAAWAETLALFRQANINQPVLRGQYEVTDSVTKQGLRLTTYRASEAEIPYLKVYYQDTITRVHRIETAFQEDNLLYSTDRRMRMDFRQNGEQTYLQSFETVGRQKMILRDSVRYVARGEVLPR